MKTRRSASPKSIKTNEHIPAFMSSKDAAELHQQGAKRRFKRGAGPFGIDTMDSRGIRAAADVIQKIDPEFNPYAQRTIEEQKVARAQLGLGLAGIIGAGNGPLDPAFITGYEQMGQALVDSEAPRNLTMTATMLGIVMDREQREQNRQAVELASQLDPTVMQRAMDHLNNHQ